MTGTLPKVFRRVELVPLRRRREYGHVGCDHRVGQCRWHSEDRGPPKLWSIVILTPDRGAGQVRGLGGRAQLGEEAVLGHGADDAGALGAGVEGRICPPFADHGRT